MTNDLDSRARAGARALHDAVRDVPVPTVSPTRAPRRPRLVLVAAAVIAVVALAVTLVGGGDDDARVSTQPPSTAPRLVLDPAPTGMAATGAVDLPSGDPAAEGTFWVYGDAGAADPFGDRDLGLVLLPDDGSTTGGTDGSGDTSVDGHPAHVSGGPDQQTGLRSVFVELDGSVLGVLSATLDDDGLLAAADELDLDATTLEPPATVAGLERVGTATGAIDASLMGALPVTSGHVARYGSTGTDGPESIVLASVAGQEGTIAVARWSLGASAQPIEVGGAQGWSGSLGDESTMVVWQETPSEVIALLGKGVDDAVLLAAAESVRPATEAQWAELVAMAHDVRVPSDALIGVTSDEVDGSAYVAYVAADGSVCLVHDSSDGSVASCSEGSGAQEIDVYTERLGSGDIVLYGYTTVGTDGELRIEAPDGSLAGVMEAFGADGTLFAGVFTDEALPAEIVVRDARGVEVGRVPIAGLGSEAGSSGAGFSGQGTPITEP